MAVAEKKPQRQIFYLVPTGPGIGLTSVSLGLVRALDQQGLHVGFLKPIRQPRNGDNGPERSTHFLRAIGGLNPPDPLPYQQAESMIHAGNKGRLLEDIVDQLESLEDDATVIIVEGLKPTAERPELEELNQDVVKALDAQVVIVSSPCGEGGLSAFSDRIEQIANHYGGPNDPRVVGCIVNKLNEPCRRINGASAAFDRMPPALLTKEDLVRKCPIFQKYRHFRLLAAIPWEKQMLSPRTCDMKEHLEATALFEGDMYHRRISDISVVAMTLTSMAGRIRRDKLMIVPGDRDDILLAACMAELNGVPLAGVVLTGGLKPKPYVLKLCHKAFQAGLPLLLTKSDSYVTAAHAATIDVEVNTDDLERMTQVMDGIAARIEIPRSIRERISNRKPRMSPPAFMHRLVTQARLANRRILLPEGDDPRIVRAAIVCHERGIAQCVLLGNPDEVQRLAEAQGMQLPNDIEIIQPTCQLREKYVDAMVLLRKHKGMTVPSALAQLEDITVVATMMLAQGEVDGLVSGACHSTANTVRPALQLIKTQPGARIISSIFFMCLPDQVVIYGDCAINPDPNAEELADIALQSAASAEAFGIEPRVAMLSYSTGNSGSGCDVEKVRQATKIAKTKRPDLVIDGPLQYDAASAADVAKSKAPHSPVAGNATVLIFPDLNTGNTTYKAVQRTADLVAVGPMLQGLRRPVNDLSRGALVDDIVYTIALTAIQAEQGETVNNETVVLPSAAHGALPSPAHHRLQTQDLACSAQ